MFSVALLLIAHTSRGGGTSAVRRFMQDAADSATSTALVVYNSFSVTPPPHIRKLTGYSATCTQAGLSEILLLINLGVWRSRNITIYTLF